MTNDLAKVEHKLKVKLKPVFLLIFALCILAFSVPLLSLYWRPQGQPLDAWFSRSGALTTALAVIVQVQNNTILEKIVGTCFAESWNLHNEYKGTANVANLMSAFLIVYGTVIWGYGDLIIKSSYLTEALAG